MKKALILVLVVAAVLAGYVGWRAVRSPTHLLSGSVNADGEFEHVDKSQNYAIDITLPNRTALWRWWNPTYDTAVRRTMENWFIGDIAQFKQTIDLNAVGATSTEGQPPEQTGGYSYSTTYQHFVASSSKLYSYEYDIYVNTGGAHPNSYFKTFVFDSEGSQVQLGDLFVAGSDYLDRIASTSEASIANDLQTRLGIDAIAALFPDGLAPTEDNYSSFVVDGDTLILLFPPYQVAAYAAGDFEVRIPLSDLSDILKPEWK